MGVSKESISKFLIENRVHVKLRILSPYSNSWNIAVSGSFALLRAFCQWKVEHQIRKYCVKGLILRNMAGREKDAGCLHESGYKQ